MAFGTAPRYASIAKVVVMPSRRSFLLSAFALYACKPAPPTAETLAASAPVDPAFEGCKKSCGSSALVDRSKVRVQPGATIGDAAYCPVSGAVFRITEETPRRDARGKTLFFCCPSCAAWFVEHEAEVLAKRGLV